MEVDKIIRILKYKLNKHKNPIVTEVADLHNDPFKVLISCVLSLRAKDVVTAKAAKKLFEKASTPKQIMELETSDIEKIIYPVGFYKTKAKRLNEICKVLIENYHGKVPNKEEELLKLKGVGRKTMNIVMTYGFHSAKHIAVDTHVHRISNRLEWVKTKKPEETEQELLKAIPKKHWHDINNDLVMFGQNICVPISPFCSKCPVNKYCPKIGVTRNR